MRRLSIGLAAACIVSLVVAMSMKTPNAASQPRASSFDCGITSPLVVGGSSVFPQLAKLRASFLVLAVRWADVAKTQPTNGRDPEDAAYDWTSLDTAFARADAAGIEIVPEIYATPGWANGGRSSVYGPTAPSDYADFLVAMATRYPQIRRWVIWGEPSRPQQWQPQGRAGADATRSCSTRPTRRSRNCGDPTSLSGKHTAELVRTPSTARAQRAG